jgi:hypothetical protein
MIARNETSLQDRRLGHRAEIATGVEANLKNEASLVSTDSVLLRSADLDR